MVTVQFFILNGKQGWDCVGGAKRFSSFFAGEIENFFGEAFLEGRET